MMDTCHHYLREEVLIQFDPILWSKIAQIDHTLAFIIRYVHLEITHLLLLKIKHIKHAHFNPNNYLIGTTWVHTVYSLAKM